MGFFNFFKERLSDQDEMFLQKIVEITQFRPTKIHWYKTAFLHSAKSKFDNKGNPINYERLEFLGDAILDAIISDYLFHKIPSGNEGYLTQMRSKIVNRKHLNEIGENLNLIALIKTSSPSLSQNIHGDLFESLVGAIYVDKGYNSCAKFVKRSVIIPYVDISKLERKITSYKSLLIEWCQKNKSPFKYEIFEDSGNQAVKYFGVKLFIGDKVISKARATSKKEAEEIASKRAYYSIRDEINSK